MNINNSFDIFVNIYAHYPIGYNGTVIGDKLNKYFVNYFCNNRLINSKYSENCYVMINSAPHSEKESIVVEIVFSEFIDESLNKEKTSLELKEFIREHFNNYIDEIDIKFRSR